MNKMMIGITLGLMLGCAAQAEAAGRVVAGGIRARAGGGVVAGHVAGFRGPNGAAGIHGRRTVTDGQGDAHTASAGAWRGPDGGTVTSHGSATRNADGSGNFSRSTSATGAQGGSYNSSTSGATGQGITHNAQATGSNGNSYTGQTTVTKDGVTHTGSCSNAAGATIPCH
jgi:hypothetical protein